LPKVGTSDTGTWRRLVVIPFNAVIEGNSDIKNYSDYLFKNAGGAILSWIIEGARKYIASNYKLDPPECVKQAISNYRSNNDWVSNYLYERCEIDKSFTQKAGEFYKDYREYCTQTGGYIRSQVDFKASIEGAGYEWKRTKTGGMYYGFRLSQNSQPDEIPPLPDYVIKVPTPTQARVTVDYGGIQTFSESEPPEPEVIF
jgi:phage/plasmid-associated DNA primase